MQKTFNGVYVDINRLATQIEYWLKQQKYHTQVINTPNYAIVQAKKIGILRTIFGADRAFTVRLSGGMGILNVDVGLADWLKAADVTEDVIAALVFTPLALVEGIEELYNLHIEREIMEYIEQQIQSGMFNTTPNMYNNPNTYNNPGQFSQPQNPPQYQQPTGWNAPHKSCPNCGYENPPNARFCMSCGYRLQ